MEQAISLIGGIFILILFSLLWSYLKYKRIIKIMNKDDLDELNIRGFFKEKKYNRFIINKKIKKIKKILIFISSTILLLVLISLGGHYA